MQLLLCVHTVFLWLCRNRLQPANEPLRPGQVTLVRLLALVARQLALHFAERTPSPTLLAKPLSAELVAPPHSAVLWHKHGPRIMVPRGTSKPCNGMCHGRPTHAYAALLVDPSVGSRLLLSLPLCSAFHAMPLLCVFPLGISRLNPGVLAHFTAGNAGLAFRLWAVPPCGLLGQLGYHSGDDLSTLCAAFFPSPLWVCFHRP